MIVATAESCRLAAAGIALVLYAIIVELPAGQARIGIGEQRPAAVVAICVQVLSLVARWIRSLARLLAGHAVPTQRDAGPRRLQIHGFLEGFGQIRKMET